MGYDLDDATLDQVRYKRLMERRKRRRLTIDESPLNEMYDDESEQSTIACQASVPTREVSCQTYGENKSLKELQNDNETMKKNYEVLKKDYDKLKREYEELNVRYKRVTLSEDLLKHNEKKLKFYTGGLFKIPQV